MIVCYNDVKDYIFENTDIYTCIVNDQKLIIKSDGAYLHIEGIHGEIYSIEDTVIKIRSTIVGNNNFIRGELPQGLIDSIRQHRLHCNLKRELKALLPAAGDMVDHYRSLPSHRSADVRIRMYVLKDIGYHQTHKGHVIINPLECGQSETGGDFIKGYVHVQSGDVNAIKYETVQAWRYKEITVSDLHLLNDIPADEWTEVMSNQPRDSYISGIGLGLTPARATVR